MSYNSTTNRIEIIDESFDYEGTKQETEKVLNEMIYLDREGRAYEDRLQVYFTENIGKSDKLEPITGKSNELIWIANEVYCGVGMQKIDIFTILSDQRDNKTFNLVELKSIAAYPEMKYQLERYALWTGSYIKGAINSNIQPIIVTRKIENAYKRNGEPYKVKIERDRTKSSLIDYNNKKISLEAKWFEFSFLDNDISFEEIDYK